MLLSFSLPLSAQADDITMAPESLIADSVDARDVEISPFGTYVAIYDTSEGNSLRVFDAALHPLWKYQMKYYWSGSLGQGSVIQISPDESFILFPAARTENDIAVCDIANGDVLSVLNGHNDDVRAIALSPDGQSLVSAARGELILWNRKPGDTPDFELSARFTGFGLAVQSLEFLPGGQKVAISGGSGKDRKISVYDLSSGDFSTTGEYAFSDNNISDDIDQLAISSDGRWLAADYRDSLLIFTVGNTDISLHQKIENIDVESLFSLTFSPDGTYLVTGHYGFLRWWKLAGDQWTEAAVLPTQRGTANDIEISPDGRKLFLASRSDNSALVEFSLEGIPGSAVGRIADLLGVRFTGAQMKVLNPAGAAGVLSSLDTGALDARDMFETADEYAARRESARSAVLNGIIAAIESAYGLQESAEDAGVHDVSIPLSGKGVYDIETRTYTLPFLETNGSIRISRDPARELYSRWQDAEVLASRTMTDSGPAFVDFRLIHPDSGVEYPVILNQDPFSGRSMNPAARIIPAISVGPDLILRDLTLSGIFPTMYRSYSEQPFGSFTLENQGSGIISNVAITLGVEGLSTSDTRLVVPSSIAAGQKIPVQLTALLNPDVLDTVEGTTAAIRLDVSYRRLGETYNEDIIRHILILNRNAIQWQDDRRLGAFMSISNASVLSWSVKVVSGDDIPVTPVFTRNISYAMKIFDSLKAAGVKYVVDPNSAYETLSKNSVAVDFLRFPAETLLQGAGDCDDLSVLYATLLEAVGVPTAFITTPGHIFTAFDTGLSPASASRYFDSTDGLIIRDNRVWMPVETTVIVEGFVRAWQIAALQWRRAEENANGNMFTAEQAWSAFPPVSIPGIPGSQAPELPGILNLVKDDQEAFRALEMEPRLGRLKADEQHITPAAYHNRMGILYASYGLFARAEKEFDAAIGNGNYIPALINQANVMSILGDELRAREYLERARQQDPENARILMGIALSWWQSGNQSEARSAYSSASSIDPELARKFPLFSREDDTSARAGVESSNLFIDDWVED